jgi:Tol biopolymer transport system component
MQLGSFRTVTVAETTGVFASSWSPTSARLAFFASSPGDESTVWIVRFDREGPTVEWRGSVGGPTNELCWSESGRYLAWGSRSGGVVLDITGPDGVGGLPRARSIQLRWSANDVLAVGWNDGDEARLAIARPDDGFILHSIPLPDGVHDPELKRESDAWSPDGSRLLFAARDRAFPSADIGVQRLYVTTDRAELASAVSIPVTTRHASPSHARWSPDGRLVVYDETEPRSDSHSLTRGAYVTALDASPPVRIGANGMGERLAWTADGGLVALESEGARTEAVRITLDDRVVEREVLFTRASSSAAPVLAPDGEHGFVVFHTRSATAALWDVERGELRDLGTRDTYFLDGNGWSPDGTRFVFVADFSLFELDATTGEVRTVADEVRRYRSEPAPPWSPGSEGYYFFGPDGGISVRDVRRATTRELTRSSTRVIGWQRVAE